MYLYIALLSVFLICGQSAMAEESTQVLAEKFVVLLHYDEQFVKYYEACIAQEHSVSPEMLIAKSPDYFGGIRPGHPKWAAVKAAYGRYFEEACLHPTKTEFLQALSSTYARTLTPEQLQESIRFYSSKTGDSLIAAHKQAAGAVYESWTEINSRYVLDLNTKFQREITEIVSAK